MYLEVRENGSKYWRMKYRMAGKEKLLSFGVYPEVRPPEARAKAKAERDLIRAGTDPGEKKKAIKREAVITHARTFEIVAHEWMEVRKTTVAIGQYEKTMSLFSLRPIKSDRLLA